MTLYAGIDLHSTNSLVAVIDQADRLQHSRRYPNDLALIREALAPYSEELAGVVVESTYNWYWLVDGLAEAGYTMHLANTAAIVQYQGLKHGNDVTDARHLANLRRLDILPEGYIYPKDQRGLRDALRYRLRLVQQAVQLLQSIQSLWARVTGRRLSANDAKRLDQTAIEQHIADESLRAALTAQVAVWQAVQTQIDALVRQVRGGLRQAQPQLLRLLQTAPGVGDVLGATILLETGPVDRFARVGDYSSYCRMVEAKRISNGKQKGQGNTRCGNRYLAWAYIEAATFAIRYYPAVARWHDRKAAKAHRIVAKKATAHKLARGCYHVLRDQAAFDIERAFA